jgi:hypothetical protein
MPVASRLVQMPSSSRRPGIGGTIGSAPVATTTCSAVCRVRHMRGGHRSLAGLLPLDVLGVPDRPFLVAAVAERLLVLTVREPGALQRSGQIAHGAECQLHGEVSS